MSKVVPLPTDRQLPLNKSVAILAYIVITR